MSADNPLSRRHSDEAGQALAELVIVAPLLLLVALLMIFFGRIESAQGDVGAAARAGAEAAVVQGNAAAAQSSAAAAVAATLASDQVACPSPAVSTDVTNFVAGGSVTVTVTCVTQLSDVTAPGLPGTKTFSATATAPIDPYSVTNGFSASAGTSGSARSMGGLS